MCGSCRAALRPLRPPRCARCGAPTAWPVERCRECVGRRLAFASASSAVAYAGPARPFLRAWKEGGLRHLAPTAAELIADLVEPPAADAITAIPPDSVRQLERSTHPAEALTGLLASRWEIEPVRLLARTRHADRQTSLPFAGRRVNVQGAFAPVVPAPRRVLLIDDVYTTGATASAAASALRASGARHVEVVTFARAVR
jgi:predicted amidophosphoribosyltransferase